MIAWRPCGSLSRRRTRRCWRSWTQRKTASSTASKRPFKNYVILIGGWGEVTKRLHKITKGRGGPDVEIMVYPIILVARNYSFAEIFQLLGQDARKPRIISRSGNRFHWIARGGGVNLAQS